MRSAISLGGILFWRMRTCRTVL